MLGVRQPLHKATHFGLEVVDDLVFFCNVALEMIDSTLSLRGLSRLNLELHLQLLQFFVETKNLPVFFLKLLSVIILTNTIIDQCRLHLFIILYHNLSLGASILTLRNSLTSLAIHAILNPHKLIILILNQVILNLHLVRH